MNDNPPTIAEIAALTARLRALSNAGAAADSAELARFLADKDAVIARVTAAELADKDVRHEHSVIENRTDSQVAEALPAGPWADYRTYSPAEAVDELVARGVPPTQAPGLLDRYLNEMTAPLNRSAAEWDIDEDDLAVIVGSETLDRSRDDSPSPDVQVEAWLEAARDAVAEARSSSGGTVDASLIDELTAAAAAGLVELESRYADLDEMALERDESRTAPAGLSGAEGKVLDAGPALSAEEAVQDLAADGRPLEEARAMVRGYLDDASERVGTSVHLWGLDEADLAAMRADPIERARAAAAILDVASEPPDTAKTEQAEEDGWSR